jgi:hypothetical protein
LGDVDGANWFDGANWVTQFAPSTTDKMPLSSLSPLSWFNEIYHPDSGGVLKTFLKTFLKVVF